MLLPIIFLFFFTIKIQIKNITKNMYQYETYR
jgi:hypothetical protein